MTIRVFFAVFVGLLTAGECHAQQSNLFENYKTRLLFRDLSTNTRVYNTNEFNQGIAFEDSSKLIVMTSCYIGYGYIFNLDNKEGYIFSEFNADTLTMGGYGVKWYSDSTDSLRSNLSQNILYFVYKDL